MKKIDDINTIYNKSNNTIGESEKSHRDYIDYLFVIWIIYLLHKYYLLYRYSVLKVFYFTKQKETNMI